RAPRRPPLPPGPLGAGPEPAGPARPGHRRGRRADRRIAGAAPRGAGALAPVRLHRQGRAGRGRGDGQLGLGRADLARGGGASAGVAGADLLGDWSPVRVRGLLRRALHLTEHPRLAVEAEEAERRNDRANLALLEALRAPWLRPDPLPALESEPVPQA